MNTQFHSSEFVLGLNRPESDLCDGQRFVFTEAENFTYKIRPSLYRSVSAVPVC
jgi:hypothetical protein